ncbi:class I SAM-dependent methyltransferase [Alicyclobacillus tolerans]|uniref:tRNA (adenine(22)-N(1))-methyltransferase n=1 Tax=Alicyclobacillus tolerans TaxID=90970 RepID=UPI001F42152A|nr:class I SAM-dependent methyltransferase [Alicyclobacillus tolerans]MCF8563351.1 class I SAM-dependent methyltransferase [Alicyclobacillus tolerans]
MFANLTVAISRRLRAIADLVPRHSKLVDVGTDHALLPVYLSQQHTLSYAVATDISEGPYTAALQNVRAFNLERQVSVRLGPGLSTVAPGEVDTVVIAGMGGSTAVEILTESPKVMEQVELVVIQPMNASQRVRSYWRENGYVLSVEAVILEDDRYYEIMAARRLSGSEVEGRDPAYSSFLGSEDELSVALELGPTLLVKPTDTFIEFARAKLARWKSIAGELEHSRQPASTVHRNRLIRQTHWLEKWMNHHQPEDK